MSISFFTIINVLDDHGIMRVLKWKLIYFFVFIKATWFTSRKRIKFSNYLILLFIWDWIFKIFVFHFALRISAKALERWFCSVFLKACEPVKYTYFNTFVNIGIYQPKDQEDRSIFKVREPTRMFNPFKTDALFLFLG